MAYAINNMENNYKFANEDSLKASKFSVHIQAPRINTNIRDCSCIVTFPRDTSENRLTRALVETVMKRERGDLFKNVILNIVVVKSCLSKNSSL